MANVPFKYAPMFQMGEDKTEYRLLTKEGVTVSTFEGHEIVKVSKEALTLLAQQAFHDVEFIMPRHRSRASSPSARIPAPPSSTVKKASRSGPASRMKRH